MDINTKTKEDKVKEIHESFKTETIKRNNQSITRLAEPKGTDKEAKKVWARFYTEMKASGKKYRSNWTASGKYFVSVKAGFNNDNQAFGLFNAERYPDIAIDVISYAIVFHLGNKGYDDLFNTYAEDNCPRIHNPKVIVQRYCNDETLHGKGNKVKVKVEFDRTTKIFTLDISEPETKPERRSNPDSASEPTEQSIDAMLDGLNKGVNGYVETLRLAMKRLINYDAEHGLSGETKKALKAMADCFEVDLSLAQVNILAIDSENALNVSFLPDTMQDDADAERKVVNA